jgi:hypothetical protein
MVLIRNTLELIILCRKKAMGDLGCLSKIVEELLTVILATRFSNDNKAVCPEKDILF